VRLNLAKRKLPRMGKHAGEKIVNCRDDELQGEAARPAGGAKIRADTSTVN
jgi:hypothetical protein